MIQHFSPVILMERTAAGEMLAALKTGDAAALNIFKRGPRSMRIDGTDVVLKPCASVGMNSGGAGYNVVNGIAVIGILGPMFAGGADYGFADQNQITAQVNAAAADRSVTGIMLYISSPGGSVDGTQSLSDAIKAANTIKPVIVYADSVLASAAQWVASSAREIYINSTGMAGSIGVIVQTVDASRAYDSAGIKVTNIKTGKFKDTGDVTQPMTADGLAYYQGLVDKLFSFFVADVVRGRGMSEAAVRSLEAKVFIGADAARVGLVDAVATFDEAWGVTRRMSDKNYRGVAGSTGAARAKLNELAMAEMGILPRVSSSKVINKNAAAALALMELSQN